MHKEPCPRCRSRGEDKAGDNLQVYGEGQGSHCFACNYTVPSDKHKEKMGWNEEELEMVSEMAEFTEEDHDKLKQITTFRGAGYRGITDETYKYFGVRHEYEPETGDMVAQYYPATKEYKCIGYKKRKLPKTFTCLGPVGADNDLFGEFRFKAASGKYIVIVGGEIDQLSAYQMLRDYQVKKGNDQYDPIPVVSPSTGEGSSAKQLQAKYDFLNRFERIVLCFDNDKAGQEAQELAASVLPKGKVWVMDMALKDPNSYIWNRDEGTPNKCASQWVSAFFKAKQYTPNGILPSTSLMDKMVEQAMTPKIPLPPFMHRLQDMMAGGIPLGVIVNLGSASGTGKSTIADECTYHWIFNSPHKIGVVSLESDAGQYGFKILSRHVGTKIDLISTVEDKVAYLSRQDVIDKANELWFNTDGTPRWYLVEDRDGGITSLQDLIMSLIIKCECKVIILDPLQDILDGLGNEEQSLFLKWMKGMVKSHSVTFINISHVRKSGGDKKANSTGADIHEEDMQGSSTIFKSGACNLLFTRNKEAASELERNTTKMKATKIRWTGHTGIAGEYYYSNRDHKMYDLQDWLRLNSSKS